MKARIAYEWSRAVAQLVREWRFTLAVVSLLGLSTGATGSLYALTRALLLRPIAISDAEHLVSIYPVSSIGTSMGFLFPTLAALESRQQSVEHLCGFSRGTVRVEVNGSYGSQGMEAVSGKCLNQWRVTAVLGRLIDESDASLHKQPLPVVVLTYPFWQRLGADRSIVGSTLRVEGSTLTVIGVAEPTFTGLHADQGPALIVPLGLAPKLTGSVPRATYAIGKLRAGVTPETAQAELNVGWREIWESTSKMADVGPLPKEWPPIKVDSLRGGFSDLRSTYRLPLLVLSGLATVLLLLTVLNVSGLVLSRTIERSFDRAVLLWMGAGTLGLMLRSLFEAVIVGALVFLCATSITFWLSQSLAASIWTGRLPLTLRVAPDAQFLSLVAVICLAVSFAVWLPSVFTIRYRSSETANGSGRTSTSSPSIARRALVAAQVTATVVLSFCAVLLVRDLRAILVIGPGYEPAGLSWTRLEARPGVPRDTNPGVYLRQIMEKVSSASAPAVAFALRFPTIDTSVPPGRVSHVIAGNDQATTNAYFDLISAEYFDVTGIPILRGRGLSWFDEASQPNVAVVNEALEKSLFGGRDAIGQQIRVGVAPTGRVSTIIGVVGNATIGDPRLVGTPIIYTPLLQQPVFATSPNMLVRQSDGERFDSIRSAVDEFGRHFVTSITPLRSQNAVFLVRENTMVWLSMLFAIIGLLVSAAGLYAAVAFDTHRRSREIAIRVALGATRSTVVWTVTRSSLLFLSVGALAGIPLAIGARSAVRALLSSTNGSGTTGLLLAVFVTCVVSITACLLPALRLSTRTYGNALASE